MPKRDHISISQENLPGIGIRNDFLTELDRRVGVITRRDGHRELLVYKKDDPDSVEASIHLTPTEADTLVEFLGTKRIIERLSSLTDQVKNLQTLQISVPAGSPADGTTKGDLDVKKKTGASIVAVRRGDDITLSPMPDYRFAAGDIVAIVGDEDSLAAARKLIEG